MASTHYATPMSPEISENTISVDTCPKPIFYLANGPSDGPIIIFVHGWPELGLSYRHQLAALGSLGFRCIAPDMRGYGRSYIPTHHSECEDEHNVNDLIALLDKLRGNNSKAIFIGHDWGGPIVWQLAAHHPERCAGAGGLVVPHGPLSKANSIVSIDFWKMQVHDKVKFPDGAEQWDYQVHHNENYEASHKELDANIPASVAAIFTANYKKPKGDNWNKYLSMRNQVKRYEEWKAKGGEGEMNSWYPEGLSNIIHTIKRDERMLSENNLNRYIESIERNGGFRIPSFYYQNHRANDAYKRSGVKNEGILHMPTLFITAEYDTVCTPEFGKRMDAVATNLTKGHAFCGHWIQQERPKEVNAMIVNWIATKIPEFWPKSGREEVPSNGSSRL